MKKKTRININTTLNTYIKVFLSLIFSRGKKNVLVLFIGYNKGKYCEVTINYPKNFSGKIIGVQVTSKCTDEIKQCYEAYKYAFF